jgi:hypothetical protein
VSLSHVAELIAAVATVAAAIAALATIYFARQTVAEAREARREGHAAHLAELAELAAVRTATEQTIKEQQMTAMATLAAHEEEMEERGAALEHERELQRLAQLNRIADLLQELADVARIEIFQSAPKSPPPQPIPWSPIPGICRHLEVAIAVYESLGGAKLESIAALAGSAPAMGKNRAEIAGTAIDELAKLVPVASSDLRLRLADQR